MEAWISLTGLLSLLPIDFLLLLGVAPEFPMDILSLASAICVTTVHPTTTYSPLLAPSVDLCLGPGWNTFGVELGPSSGFLELRPHRNRKDPVPLERAH